MAIQVLVLSLAKGLLQFRRFVVRVWNILYQNPTKRQIAKLAHGSLLTVTVAALKQSACTA